jgi:hypothetical protein
MDERGLFNLGNTWKSTVFLPLYNSTENLRENFHSISSTVKASCSGKVQLYLTHLKFTVLMNINIINFVRFKAFLTVSMEM